jgi:hypothetical protein
MLSIDASSTRQLLIVHPPFLIATTIRRLTLSSFQLDMPPKPVSTASKPPATASKAPAKTNETSARGKETAKPESAERSAGRRTRQISTKYVSATPRCHSATEPPSKQRPARSIVPPDIVFVPLMPLIDRSRQHDRAKPSCNSASHCLTFCRTGMNGYGRLIAKIYLSPNECLWSESERVSTNEYLLRSERV